MGAQHAVARVAGEGVTVTAAEIKLKRYMVEPLNMAIKCAVMLIRPKGLSPNIVDRKNRGWILI